MTDEPEEDPIFVIPFLTDVELIQDVVLLEEFNAKVCAVYCYKLFCSKAISTMIICRCFLLGTPFCSEV